MVKKLQKQRRHLKLCVSCNTRVANRPRGVCYGCYYNEEIRATHKALVYYYRDFDSRQLKDPEPTTALPGTNEKIAVLQYRFNNKQKMFHPLDATLEMN